MYIRTYIDSMVFLHQHYFTTKCNSLGMYVQSIQMKRSSQQSIPDERAQHAAAADATNLQCAHRATMRMPPSPPPMSPFILARTGPALATHAAS